jgi:hypothetical protein
VKLQHLLRNSALVAVFGAFALAAASPAHANTIIWTDWTSATGTVAPGTPAGGTATGTMGGITVTYSGQITSLANVGVDAFFNPDTPYVGGVIGNAPTVNGVEMTGPLDGETITFSSSVTNPVMAIWSLGEVGTPGVFVFHGLDLPFILEAGGPDGITFPGPGQSISACQGITVTAPYSGTGCNLTQYSTGTVADGVEGSGSIMFQGTYTSISFDTPDQEWSYGFTVGEQTPEPETLSLLGLGLLALPLLRASLARRRRA